MNDVTDRQMLQLQAKLESKSREELLADVLGMFRALVGLADDNREVAGVTSQALKLVRIAMVEGKSPEDQKCALDQLDLLVQLFEVVETNAAEVRDTLLGKDTPLGEVVRHLWELRQSRPVPS
jgi:hypothetical protein